MTRPSKAWSKTTGHTVIDVAGDYPQSAGLGRAPFMIEEGEKQKTPTVLDTAPSDGSTERDQFLRQQLPPVPEPYTGARDH